LVVTCLSVGAGEIAVIFTLGLGLIQGIVRTKLGEILTK
jgi:hypothetical protein